MRTKPSGIARTASSTSSADRAHGASRIFSCVLPGARQRPERRLGVLEPEHRADQALAGDRSGGEQLDRPREVGARVGEHAAKRQLLEQERRRDEVERLEREADEQRSARAAARSRRRGARRRASRRTRTRRRAAAPRRPRRRRGSRPRIPSSAASAARAGLREISGHALVAALAQPRAPSAARSRRRRSRSPAPSSAVSTSDDRAHRDRERLGQRAGAVVDGVRQREQHPRVDDDALGVAAGPARCRGRRRVATACGQTCSSPRGRRSHSPHCANGSTHDAVARRPALDALAERRDAAAELVPGDRPGREQRGDVAEVQVRAADAAVGDVEQRLRPARGAAARARRRAAGGPRRPRRPASALAAVAHRRRPDPLLAGGEDPGRVDRVLDRLAEAQVGVVAQRVLRLARGP